MDSAFKGLKAIISDGGDYVLWQAVPHPDSSVEKSSVQCACVGAWEIESVYWCGCAPACVSPSGVTWREHVLEVPGAVWGVHFVQDCGGSNLSSVAQAVNGEGCTGSVLIDSNYSECLPLNIVQQTKMCWWGTHPSEGGILHHTADL